LSEWRSARIEAASSMWSWKGSSRSSVAPPSGTASAASISAADFSPDRFGVRCQPAFLFGGQGSGDREALVDQRAERDEPFARGRVVLLDGGIAEVVGLHEQVPDLLDALGLLDGLLTELLECRDREAERDQTCPGDRRDGEQHGRERQPQAVGER
jgi:hypothetical protein